MSREELSVEGLGFPPHVPGRVVVVLELWEVREVLPALWGAIDAKLGEAVSRPLERLIRAIEAGR
jgi:hypothetical protein